MSAAADDRLAAGEPSVPAGGASVPAAQPTGHPRVDAAVARLQGLDDAPLAEHVAVYGEVHRLLQDALSDLDGA